MNVVVSGAKVPSMDLVEVIIMIVVDPGAELVLEVIRVTVLFGVAIMLEEVYHRAVSSRLYK